MPAVALFIAGAVALGFAMGFPTVQRFATGWLNAVPIIGPIIAKTISLDAKLVDWLWNQLTAFTAGVQLPTVRHATEQGLNVQAHQATHDALSRTKNVTIPQAVAAGLQPTNAALSQLGNGTTAFIGQQVQWDNSTSGQIEGVTHSVDVTLPAEIAATNRQVAANLQTVTTTITGVQQQTERDIAAMGQQAAAQGQAGAVAQLTPQIGSIQTTVGGLANTITGAGGLGLTGVITLAQSLVGRVTTVEECTAGICSSGSGSLLGDLGKILGDLAPLIADGALFALVAYAAANPEQAAGDLDALAGGLVDGAAKLFGDAVGVVSEAA